MTETELEQLVDLDLAGFLAATADMSAEDLQQVRSHPVVIYIMYRVSTPAQRRELFPASEEYYLAQARIADRRWSSSVKRHRSPDAWQISLCNGPATTSDVVPELGSCYRLQCWK
jgi:hypothetical protein